MIANYKGNEYYYSCKIIPYECDWRYYKAIHEEYSSIGTYNIKMLKKTLSSIGFGKWQKKWMKKN